MPPFETIVNFVDFAELRKGPLSGSAEGVLLTLLELGTFIGWVTLCLPVSREYGLNRYFSYHEAHPDKSSFDAVSTSLAGLGIGLLATAAVSLASNISDLPLSGAQVVRQAFRLGILVDDMSQNLQTRAWTEAGTLDSWAYVLPDVTAQQVQNELDKVYSTEVRRYQHVSIQNQY